ncbi:MAG: glutamine synthetase family protein [Anaerolineae bacterium]|nr:glutamine synthetase family protein [Anaerolineae bacterium]NUQ06152.1 glutamine synthetase [Anaerolineae bacterium]
MATPLREFLELPYDQLEEWNLEAKRLRAARTPADQIQELRLKYLTDEKRIKAVTVCFTDLEGRLHMLDYDKKFLLKSADNLTFDGSSVRGFTAQAESDLRLAIDWSAFYWLPSDVFGPGKVLVFGEVLEKDGTPFAADVRSRLKLYTEERAASAGLTFNASNEIEGFLFKGSRAEQAFVDTRELEFVGKGGYYHSLPSDPLRSFIDAVAEGQRALGYENEKDHPEVAPSQFELNYSYAEAMIAADQVQLYKLLCRQVAEQRGMTASFLPKPVAGVNGSGMHTNLSISQGGKNIFWDAAGAESISATAWDFIHRTLNHARDICLILNSSVNAYRRLDPHYEAPNQIKSSPVDRGSMIRIPVGNSRSARVEVRSVGADANPYLVLYALLRTGTEGALPAERVLDTGRYLPDNIYDAIDDFAGSAWVAQLLGADVQAKYAELKRASADRCPRLLGSVIKRSEIQFHHEVQNQSLWNNF